MLRNVRETARIVAILCFSVSALVAEMGLAGGINKWVDENDRVHFGEKPPSDISATAVKIPTNRAPHDELDSTNEHHSSSIEAQLRRMHASKAKAAKKRDIRNRTSAKTIKALELDSFEQWQKSFVEKCKNNHGTNCNDPGYQHGHRRLNAQERRDVRDSVNARRHRERRKLENRALQRNY